ncbi:MAG: hypothetical protein RIQ81_1089 [Pseudomonadota bacterium]
MSKPLSARLLWNRFLFMAASRNLLRSLRRTLISLLAIASAAAAMIVFQSFVDGVKKTFRKNVITSNFAHYQVTKKGYRQNDSDDPFVYQIKNSGELREKIEREVGPLRFFAQRQPFYGLINFNDRSLGGMAFGIEAAQERDFLTLVQTNSGKHLADSGDLSVFVGYKLAEKLKAKDGDLLTVLVTTQTGSMNALDLEMVGTFKSGVIQLDEGAFFIHHKVSEQLLKTEGAPLLMIGFKGDDELVHQEKLKKLISAHDPDMELVHWRQLAEFFDNTMGWVNIQFMVFRIIILIIATISIITVFMMGLMERMGEFGTMRAIGTHRGSIASMIFFESILQSTLGSVLGVGLGIVILKVFMSKGLTMPPPPLMSVPFKVSFEVPWSSIPLTLAMCVLVSGGAGILPALRMARIRITEALGRNV